MTSINNDKIERLFKRLGKEKSKSRGPHKKYIIEIPHVPKFFVSFSRGSKKDAWDKMINNYHKELKINKDFLIELINGTKTKKDYEKYIKEKYKKGEL